MILLENIFQSPMFVWAILPLAGAALLVAVLLWDTRLPAERKIIRRLRRSASGKRHHHAHKTAS